MLSKIIATACVTSASAAASQPAVQHYKTAFCPAGWDTLYKGHCPEPQMFNKFCPTEDCPYSPPHIKRDPNTCLCKCEE